MNYDTNVKFVVRDMDGCAETFNIFQQAKPLSHMTYKIVIIQISVGRKSYESWLRSVGWPIEIEIMLNLLATKEPLVPRN